MPSGAKKRKAAKKKKQQTAYQINISTKSNNGNDDPRSHDERESEDGVISPSSHDNENNQDPFKTDDKSVKEVSGFGDEGANKIEKELNPEENIEITDSGPEQDKSSSSRSSSSSSSSSSDDESQEVEMRDEKEMGDRTAELIANSLSKQAISAAAIAPLSGPSANVIVENTASMDSTMSAEPNSEEEIQIENITEKASVISAVDTVVLNEDEVKPLLNANENNAKGVSASDENAQAYSGAIDSDVKENEGKTLPVSDPIPEINGVLESIKESEAPTSHEKQAPVRPALGVAQRTSWFSCCGLFDAITGSSR